MLNESAFLKLTALVDPATVLGADTNPVAETSVGLEHLGRVRLHNDTLSLILSRSETGARQFWAKGADTFLMHLHGANEVLHIFVYDGTTFCTST
jgi:hypothetical protein